MNPPSNILLILTDQQRWDSLGCYGAGGTIPGVHTPHLDRLALQGMRFDNCYVNNTICTPSRASLWTGLHVPDHGVEFVYDNLDTKHVLFPYRLREAGYDTALLGKLHVSGHATERDARHPHDGFRVYEWAPAPYHDLDGPFAAYGNWLKEHHPSVHARIAREGATAEAIPIEAHLTTWAADRTIDYLERERPRDKPFFCCMSVFDPHNPYWMHPPEAEALINAEALPAIVAPNEPFDHRPIAHQREHDRNHFTGGGAYGYEDMARYRVGYHAAVALIDMQVGRVLDALDRAGLADSTLVIFTSDHGDMLGDHNLAVKGGFFYDACTRVPMLMRGPHVEAGTTNNAPAQLHDIAATCLSAAGVDSSNTMPDARDLRDDGALQERGYAVCAFRNSSVCVGAPGKRYDPPIVGTMWREAHWKLNVYHTDPLEGELYNLAEDPQEMNNLWSSPAAGATRDALHAKLNDWLARHGETSLVGLTENN